MPQTISIITVCLNSEETIRDTLESVRIQSRPPFEFIVLDGGSSDRTNAIIEKYADVLTFHRSEPDRGIADAMNKGLSLAKGDYILFLNSDDYLADGKVLEALENLLDEAFDIHAFDIIFKSAKSSRRLIPRCFGWRANFKTPFFHQGTLCHRRLVEKIGNFDESFHIAMDYDFFLRAQRTGASAMYHPRVLGVMRDTGISSRTDWRQLRRRFAEERRVHRKNCQGFAMHAVYGVFWLAYLPYRRLKSLLQ